MDSTKPASRSTRRGFDTVGCGIRSWRSISPTDCCDETMVDAQRRLYRLNPEPLEEVDAWLAPFRRLWSVHLDALERHLDRMEQLTQTKKKARRRRRGPGPNRGRDKGEKK